MDRDVTTVTAKDVADRQDPITALGPRQTAVRMMARRSRQAIPRRTAVADPDRGTVITDGPLRTARLKAAVEHPRLLRRSPVLRGKVCED